jgi:predicted DNA-binding transcriptional regulator AlpA
MRKPKSKAQGSGRVRLMSKMEVCDAVGASFPSIWQWMRDGKFPRSRALDEEHANDAHGGKPYWLASEVEAWILSRPVKRLKGDPGEPTNPNKLAPPNKPAWKSS